MSERLAIPARGWSEAEVMARLAEVGVDDVDYRGGRTFSLVYWAGEEHHQLVQRAHDAYLAGNALNPLAFRSLKQLETEIVQMTASLLHGPEGTVGTLTSGGTESILCAVLAWRDRARRRWPWIRRPNLVLPETAHPAFDKAAHLFGLAIRRVGVGPSGMVDPKAMLRRSDRNTVLWVASAPQYVTGVVDPIPQLGHLAAQRRIPLHVDACFGGFVLPWLERLDEEG